MKTRKWSFLLEDYGKLSEYGCWSRIMLWASSCYVFYENDSGIFGFQDHYPPFFLPAAATPQSAYTA